MDGKEVDRKTVAHTIPLTLMADETFDIGLDNQSPVDFTYEPPFKFTGTIDKLNYKLGLEQLTAEDKQRRRRKCSPQPETRRGGRTKREYKRARCQPQAGSTNSEEG